jgi:polysaccharide export outer membrane protein
VKISVFGQPDLSTDARISAQGTIAMPLLGEIKLSGLTPGAAMTTIANKLRDGKFVLNPQVSVNVTQMRSRQVSVLGQVTRPGRYALDDTSSRLTDVLALAGGISPNGDEVVTVMLARDGKTEKMDVDVSRIYVTGDQKSNINVENGDTIFVQRAPVFYIYGEVQKAGAYRLEPRMNVMQAISLGGGVTPRGTERGIKIHRQSATGSLAKLDAQPSDRVQPNDIIYVRESLF